MVENQDTIVVTGVGIVSPIGIGREPFWAALTEGRSGIRPLPFLGGTSSLPYIGGEVADFDPKQYVRPRKSLKVMSRDIQLGFAAADLACVDAGLAQGSIAPERLGVLFGADMIPCDLGELIGAYRNCIVDGRFEFHRWGQAFLADLFPLWMLKYLPNMPACHIGIAQDARGPNNTVTLGEVSTLSAIAEAGGVLKRGQADAIIAGGVGARVHPALWVRNLLFGQTHFVGDPATASRPFDAHRDGIVHAEGSAAFILETQENARSRGARVLARILGCASAFEPCGKTQPRQGKAIRHAIMKALEAAKLKPSDIGYVVAHGVSSIEDDRLEAQAIRDTLDGVPVTAPKSYFGHLGAAAGALDTAFCLLAIEHGQVPPTLNYEHPDPQCPVHVIHGGPLSIAGPNALILSHSPNGQAVALVLGKAE
jgi:3-oxoacyl-[acyl-carrier-protein] synthase II